MDPKTARSSAPGSAAPGAAGLDEVLVDAETQTVAVMCSENVWWRCHRRLIADVAVLGGDGALRWPASDN